MSPRGEEHQDLQAFLRCPRWLVVHPRNTSQRCVWWRSRSWKGQGGAGAIPRGAAVLCEPPVTPQPPARHGASLLGVSLSSAHLSRGHTLTPVLSSGIHLGCALQPQGFVCMEIFPPVSSAHLCPLDTEQVTSGALMAPVIHTGQKG